MSKDPQDDEWAFKSATDRDGSSPQAIGELTDIQAPTRSGAPPPGAGLTRAAIQTTRRPQMMHGTKVAILGATMSGKSYLFQAMTYRASNPARSGSLKVFLRNEQAVIFEAGRPDEDFRMLEMRGFNARYQRWGRLPSTNLGAQRWYKLLLHYRTGWLGLRRAEMCIDFLDGSGDAMQQKIVQMDPSMSEMFKGAYLPARVAIFCLPMWAAFPAPEMRSSPKRAEAIRAALDGFYQVVHNFKELRRSNGVMHPVQTILALTQADDRNCALSELRDFWIQPFIDVKKAPQQARELGTQRGLMRYLRDAHAVSDWLVKRFWRDDRHDVQKIPYELKFYDRWPMVVPVSAIDGTMLEFHELPDTSTSPVLGPTLAGAPSPHREERSRTADPVPAHVELPLLFALCAQHNALM